MEPHKPNVLLVDDDFVYQFAATKTIEATGLAGHVQVCNDGQDAINYLNNAISTSGIFPDIIFLDINMPVMDGWEFLEAYRAMEEKLPDSISIYLVSSSVDKNDIMRSQQFKYVTDYLVKPVYKEKFSQVLQAAHN
ncbi:MAG: response regulator [Panacibacter sp.]